MKRKKKARKLLHNATISSLGQKFPEHERTKKTRQMYCIPVTLDAHLELQGIDAKVEKLPESVYVGESDEWRASLKHVYRR